eukprot:scaffold24264_cov64-Phaeocystis_antarctica.AAC.3
MLPTCCCSAALVGSSRSAACITETAPAWSPMVESATAAPCCSSGFAGCKRADCTNPAAACCTELMTWSWNSVLVPPVRS